MNASDSWPLWDLCAEPLYVLTGDQDWAPEWATQAMVSVGKDAGLPVHIFGTNPSTTLALADALLSVGIHPSFLPGSTHGGTAAEVVGHCLGLWPGATTARCHAFAESSSAMLALAAAGITADSNGCTHLQPWISPWRHFTGIVRLPVFLEDDVLMSRSNPLPRLHDLLPALRTPGLKIFNFHPAHVGLNCATMADYDGHRPALTSPDPQPVRLPAYGIADLYSDLLEWLSGSGRTVLAFPDVAVRATTALGT